MMAIAVAPIEIPIRTRRTTPLEIAMRTGEPGCSRSTVTKHAEIMKRPNSAASIRYSGQCAVIASINPEDFAGLIRVRPELAAEVLPFMRGVIRDERASDRKSQIC